MRLFKFGCACSFLGVPSDDFVDLIDLTGPEAAPPVDAGPTTPTFGGTTAATGDWADYYCCRQDFFIWVTMKSCFVALTQDSEKRSRLASKRAQPALGRTQGRRRAWDKPFHGCGLVLFC